MIKKGPTLKHKKTGFEPVFLCFRPSSHMPE
jgi:hypothetical protein